MVKNKKIDLNLVFSSVSEPLRAVLLTSSKSITHPSTKGEASEYQWLIWLRTYLPKRYQVDSGFIIDHKGNISEQQDIIIYDRQYSPCILSMDGVLYIPAESVYAIIEVKQKLTQKNILYTGKKIASVRKLKRTSKKIKHAGGTFKAIEPHRIIGCILALENSWKNPFGKSLVSSLTRLDKYEKIDLGCALNKGSFLVNYEESKISLKKSSKNDALIFFFVQLLSKLQEIGTVPAIDFEKYLDSIQK